MCLGSYDENGNINQLVPLSPNDKIEKNWLPFMLNDEKAYICSWHPLKIYKIINNKLIEIVNKTFNVNLELCRGSAPPITYNFGYLCVVHNVHYNEPRKYYHRFIWLDNTFTKIKVSHPFYIVAPGIEYTLSICTNDTYLLMTYSFRDSSSRILFIDFEVVNNYLNNGIHCN
jgi:hypothetical protein